MEMYIDSKDKVKKEMWNRLELCIRQLQEYEDILLEDERTVHCHAEAKKRIRAAQELITDFGVSSENAEEIARINEALQNAKQYLEMLQELIPILQEIGVKEKVDVERIENELTRKEDARQDKWVHILHLSDLHFGVYIGTGDDEQNKKEFFEIIKDQLFPFFREYVKSGRRIDIVAVTGDISFRNKKEGYDDFKDWLKELCGTELLDVNIKNHVIMCPGNHDSSYQDREEKGLMPKKGEERRSDELLTIDKIRDRQDQFQLFNDTCKSLQIEPLDNFDSDGSKRTIPYVMGIKKIEDIHFIVLNSAWNSFPRNNKNGADHGQLFLGRRVIKFLLREAQIPEGEMKVMLFHHPLSWLHETEIRTYGKDSEKPTVALIRQDADVILNGHVHGGIERPDILANKTVVFGGGTLYTEDSHLNQFEIISVNLTRHYCEQEIVCYNSQEMQGHPFGWEIINEKHLTQVHYGIYKDIRELIAKYSLGEITIQEAEKEAYERLAETGVKAFRELLEKTRDYQINNVVKEGRYVVKAESATLEESVEKTKIIAKDIAESEKQS